MFEVRLERIDPRVTVREYHATRQRRHAVHLQVLVGIDQARYDNLAAQIDLDSATRRARSEMRTAHRGRMA
jgi:hypothetical protein